jgi:hypothetical protein
VLGLDQRPARRTELAVRAAALAELVVVPCHEPVRGQQIEAAATGLALLETGLVAARPRHQHRIVVNVGGGRLAAPDRLELDLQPRIRIRAVDPQLGDGYFAGPRSHRRVERGQQLGKRYTLARQRRIEARVRGQVLLVVARLAGQRGRHRDRDG